MWVGRPQLVLLHSPRDHVQRGGRSKKLGAGFWDEKVNTYNFLKSLQTDSLKTGREPKVSTDRSFHNLTCNLSTRALETQQGQDSTGSQEGPSGTGVHEGGTGVLGGRQPLTGRIHPGRV